MDIDEDAAPRERFYHTELDEKFNIKSSCADVITWFILIISILFHGIRRCRFFYDETYNISQLRGSVWYCESHWSNMDTKMI